MLHKFWLIQVFETSDFLWLVLILSLEFLYFCFKCSENDFKSFLLLLKQFWFFCVIFLVERKFFFKNYLSFPSVISWLLFLVRIWIFLMFLFYEMVRKCLKVSVISWLSFLVFKEVNLFLRSFEIFKKFKSLFSFESSLWYTWE